MNNPTYTNSLEDCLELIELPDGRTRLQIRFWRHAMTPGQVDSKKKEIIRDITDWLHRLDGESGEVRDRWIATLKSKP